MNGRIKRVGVSWLMVAALAMVALPACGDDGGGGPTCTPEVGQCPNFCKAGIGVNGEVCQADAECGCGLFCHEAGFCAPYEGGDAGCACPGDVPCQVAKFTLEQTADQADDFYEICVAKDGSGVADLIAIDPTLDCAGDPAFGAHDGIGVDCEPDTETGCRGQLDHAAAGDEAVSITGAKWAQLCGLSALDKVRVVSGLRTTDSVYTMKVSLYDGTVVDIDRDLTEQVGTKFNFGSAHIGTAVAFVVTDTITWPQSVTITLDFGKVIGMPPEFPIQSYGTGEYLFSDQPPAVEVYVELIQYKSLFDGAEGHVTLTQWGQHTGDIIAGNYAGTLVQDTALEDKLTLEVEGTFHFVLPIKHAGQPSG